MHADDGIGRGVDTTIALSPGSAREIANLLAMFADLPSTPEPVAEEARRRAADLEECLPVPHRGRTAESPEIEVVAATAIAGLLDLLGELPSTPEPVADDARRHAADMWAALPAADDEQYLPDRRRRP
ncbi:MAG: hypothetical protein WD080_09335 [Egibacteraceae bacterium]